MQRSTKAILCVALFFSALTAQAKTDPFQDKSSCIKEAAAYHGVNSDVLHAIIQVESKGNAQAINYNSNNTVDVGRGQINSVHFAELAKFGLAPEHLFNGCISDFVSAWLLGKAIRRHGNTWYGIAAYHSTTPEKNQRYQQLVYNELQRQASRGRR
jgi:soluble lytic murein transglycosylase-like protein